MVQAQSTTTLQTKHFTQPLPTQVMQRNYCAFKTMNDININKYIYLTENDHRQKRSCVHYVTGKTTHKKTQAKKYLTKFHNHMALTSHLYSSRQLTTGTTVITCLFHTAVS